MRRQIIFLLLPICVIACHGPKDKLLRVKYDRYQNIDVKYRNYSYRKDDPDNAITNEYTRMSLSVDSITPDSSYIFSARIDYCRWENSNPIFPGASLGRQSFSSDRDTVEMGPQELQLYRSIKPVLNATYTFTISHRGEIVKPFSMKNALVIPRRFALLNLDLFQVRFPSTKVAVGEEWTTEVSEPSQGAKRISHYFIQSIYGDKMQINVNGDIELPGKTKEFTGIYTLKLDTKQLIAVRLEMELNDIMLVSSIEAN